jgi:hypothetical protein
MDGSRSVSWSKLLLFWALVVAVSLPVGWMVGDYVSGPVGWMLWGVILLGAQWVLLHIVAQGISWYAVVVANAGAVAAFEYIIRAVTGDPIAMVALVALVPVIAFLIGLVVLGVFALPVGIISVVSLRLGPKAERRQKLYEGINWVRKQARGFGRLYLAYLGGVLIGSAIAFLVNGTIAQSFLANDAYIGHILVRAAFGLLVALYVWGIARLFHRQLIESGEAEAEPEGADVTRV